MKDEHDHERPYPEEHGQTSYGASSHQNLPTQLRLPDDDRRESGERAALLAEVAPNVRREVE